MVATWDETSAVLWYGACTSLGMAVLAVGQRYACAVLGPVMGGLLVASSSVFFLTNLLESKDEHTWLDSVLALLTQNTASSLQAKVVWAVGIGIWATVALLGVGRWLLAWHREEESQAEDKPEQLRRPLLTVDSYPPPPRRPGSRSGRGQLPPPPEPPRRRGGW